MKPSENLKELSIALPSVGEPVGAYLPALRVGKMVYTSGQLPMSEGKLTVTGKVPNDVSLEDAQAAARQAVLNAIAAAAQVAGG